MIFLAGSFFWKLTFWRLAVSPGIAIRCYPEYLIAILGEMANLQKVNLSKNELAKRISQSILVILFTG
jgi:hypothetical protein